MAYIVCHEILEGPPSIINGFLYLSIFHADINPHRQSHDIFIIYYFYIKIVLMSNIIFFIFIFIKVI